MEKIIKGFFIALGSDIINSENTDEVVKNNLNDMNSISNECRDELRSLIKNVLFYINGNIVNKEISELDQIGELLNVDNEKLLNLNIADKKSFTNLVRNIFHKI